VPANKIMEKDVTAKKVNAKRNIVSVLIQEFPVEIYVDVRTVQTDLVMIIKTHNQMSVYSLYKFKMMVFLS